ncbi:hypothetical protein LTR53_014147 [Teratosphaeriaceae sp. CCFEE 6253]|nr:hypothetical protein LTR53_014147 [Teratosphaeriaceae sp. CCFEE 6253]
MRERTPFPAALLERLPNLKLLLNASARNASIDLPRASALGIVVTGTKGEAPSDQDSLAALPELPPPQGFSSVVQHNWALTLALLSRIPRDDAALRTDGGGAWHSGLMVPVAGRTLGIVGLGKLGVGVARVGVLAFGMGVLAWSENLTQAKADAAAVEAGLPAGTFKVVGKAELFGRADVVSLHLVLSARTRHIVGAEELAGMKRGAVLVNTSRGPLVDEAALVDVLKAGGIRGAALDVYWEEPLPAESQWRKVGDWAKSEVVLSPHMGEGVAGVPFAGRVIRRCLLACWPGRDERSVVWVRRGARSSLWHRGQILRRSGEGYERYRRRSGQVAGFGDESSAHTQVDRRNTDGRSLRAAGRSTAPPTDVWQLPFGDRSSPPACQATPRRGSAVT